MEKTLVIGASGFIGQAIQSQIQTSAKSDQFVFSYRSHPERIQPDLQKVRLNLLEPSHAENDLGVVADFSSAICVLGNNNHGAAWENPLQDLALNTESLLRFIQLFRGKLVLLSSQAVYFGLSGEIGEQIDHCPTIPYAISKKAAESYAQFYYEDARLDSLWIYRLMYAFGPGERASRLVSACRRASLSGEKVNIAGGGCSFLNPLPSSFVSQVLVRSSEELSKQSRFSETVNINHESRLSVLDVVRFLNEIEGFDYTVSQGGEKQPVAFWGNTERLQGYMKKWQLEFPDVWSSLRHHYLTASTGGPAS
ncbi:MAG: NAD(P)-dependent oxidoreductase [Nitrososphaera sp.]